jgi:hypothetical protein
MAKEKETDNRPAHLKRAADAKAAASRIALPTIKLSTIKELTVQGIFPVRVRLADGRDVAIAGWGETEKGLAFLVPDADKKPVWVKGEDVTLV